MIETGILNGDDKVELLENFVVLKMPHNPPHDGTLDVVTGTVGDLLPLRWLYREQKAVVLSDSQLRNRTVLVVRGSRRSYFTRHPSTGATLA